MMRATTFANTMIINGEECAKLSKGSFCTAYRSIANPSTVYLIVANCQDYSKEILKLVGECKHLPTMQYIDEFEGYWRNGRTKETLEVSYVIYQTTYSTTLDKKEHKDTKALAQAKRLAEHWDIIHYSTLYKENRHQIQIPMMIDRIKVDGNLPNSLAEALECIWSWASSYDKEAYLEFPLCNLAISEDGGLILRDILVFKWW